MINTFGTKPKWLLDQ